MSQFAYDIIEDLLEGDVQLKKGKHGALSRAKKLVNYAPEVMVKVTGYAKGIDHLHAHLNYISREGKLYLEDEQGHVIQGKEDIKALVKDWSQEQGIRRKNSRDSTNIVLSMPEGTEASDVKESVRYFAMKQFSHNYQYVMALHQDTKSPHVHLTVKNLGYDGKRLHIKKADLQAWREGFADALERQGVMAEATPRAVRGVIRRDIASAIKHIRNRGLVPETDRAKAKQAIEDLYAQQKAEPTEDNRPWEAKIKARQITVRKGWLKVAKALGQSDKEEDKLLGQEIGEFVKNMPPLQTERHLLQKKFIKQINKQHDRDRDREDER